MMVAFRFYKKYVWIVLSGCFLMAIAGCKKNDDAFSRDNRESLYKGTSLDYLIEKREVFDSVLFVLNKSGLADLLKKEGYTIIVPTNRSLKLAMAELNQHRSTQGLENISIDDIDSTSWRAILGKYIIKGKWNVKAFINQDAERLITTDGRWMYGSITNNIVSGAIGVDGGKLTYSFSNGSKYIKNWINSPVATADIFTLNGILHILNESHVLGFNSFIPLASAKQNKYSDPKVFATGIAQYSGSKSEVWPMRVKKLDAIGSDGVELEIANLGKDNFRMILTVEGDGNVIITVVPTSKLISISPNYKASFDQNKLMFLLQYTYTLEDGNHVDVNEIIKYEAD